MNDEAKLQAEYKALCNAIIAAIQDHGERRGHLVSACLAAIAAGNIMCSPDPMAARRDFIKVLDGTIAGTAAVLGGPVGTA